MSADEQETEEIGVLITVASILLGGFIAFVLLFPTSLAASLVTLSAAATVLASLGFLTVFTVRHDAVAAARNHDAEIVRRVEKWARREQNLSVDDALAATTELWFSSWYRDLARSRTPPMMLLLYSGVGFVCATVVGVSWGLQWPWGLAFVVSGGLAFAALILTRVDLRALVGLQGTSTWRSVLRTLLGHDISARWEMTLTSIAYDARIRRMAVEMETPPGARPRTLNDLLSVVSGQGWWMEATPGSPRE
jgi:hypothetical protein